MKISIIINQGTTTQIALCIIKHNTEDFTNKSFTYGTEDKATLICSTALIFMVSYWRKYQNSGTFFCLCISNSHMFINATKFHINVINESFKHCFAT